MAKKEEKKPIVEKRDRGITKVTPDPGPRKKK